MGVWLRDKKWRQRGVGIKIADPRQDCYFDPAQGGLVEVEWLQVVNRLLQHPNDFEIAWDKIGIVFDSEGRAVPANGKAALPVTAPAEAVGVRPAVAPVSTKRGRGRPRK